MIHISSLPRKAYEGYNIRAYHGNIPNIPHLEVYKWDYDNHFQVYLLIH